MKTSDEGVARLAKREGLGLIPYRDGPKGKTGYWTVGYGTRTTEARLAM